MTAAVKLVTLGALALASQGKPEHLSEYQRWAAFERGAFVRYELSGEASGVRVDAEMSYTLVDVTQRKVILEGTVVRRPAPNRVEISRGRIEIPAGFIRPRTPLREGEEDLQVRGRTLRCRWIETREEAGPLLKEWFSSQIPGGLVRRKVTADGENPARTVLRLVEWKGLARLLDEPGQIPP